MSTHNISFHEIKNIHTFQSKPNTLSGAVLHKPTSPSGKHAYIMLTLLAPLLYSKTWVYRGIHFFPMSAQKHRACGYLLKLITKVVLTSAHKLCFEQKYEKKKKKKSELFI